MANPKRASSMKRATGKKQIMTQLTRYDGLFEKALKELSAAHQRVAKYKKKADHYRKRLDEAEAQAWDRLVAVTATNGRQPRDIDLGDN